MKNGILNNNQMNSLRKAVAERFVAVDNLISSEEELVKELLGGGIGSRTLIAIIEKAIKMPKNTYISWVEGEYRTINSTSTTSKGKKQPKEKELVDLIFHCGRIGDTVGISMKFRRSPHEIYELLKSTAIHYSMVVERRIEEVHYIPQ